MKASWALSVLALILHLIIPSACSPSDILEQDPLLDSYQLVHWPMLMSGYSDLDKCLGSLNKNASKDISCTHFQTSLENKDLSQVLVEQLIGIIQTSDYKVEHPAYHGFIHSARVANVTVAVLDSYVAIGLNKNLKILLTIAALFHDVDPLRIMGTPPRVVETFKWLESDKKALLFFEDLEQKTNITKGQLMAIMKYTDFDLDPKKLAAIRNEADNMVEKHFTKEDAKMMKIWGPRIAYFDQIAMYVGSYEFAVQAVVGLANEFRTLKQERQRAKGILAKVSAPSDASLLSTTSIFLLPRLKDPNFQLLPTNMQENMRNVEAAFSKFWSGRKYIN